MPSDRPTLLSRHDPALALGLMTRLPVPVNDKAAAGRGAAAGWAWPLAGALVGALAAGVFLLASTVGPPLWVAATLAIGTQIIVTGALHEDGLADAADGLWGGWTLDRRLEIMRDSRIGSYGVLALILAVLLRVGALSDMPANVAILGTLIAIGMVSRAAMLLVMWALPAARQDGLSSATGRPGTATAVLGAGLAVAVTLLLLPIGLAFALCCAAMLGSGLIALLARQKIGGQTGDILGAAQQTAEILALITLSSLV